MFAFLAALFVRGNATGLHTHVELCNEIAQEFCCEHDAAKINAHCEIPPLPEHGHCPHECREDVAPTMGTVAHLVDILAKPILRSLGFVVLPSLFEIGKRNLNRLGIVDTWPPPQIHLVRDTVRLL